MCVAKESRGYLSVRSKTRCILAANCSIVSSLGITLPMRKSRSSKRRSVSNKSIRETKEPDLVSKSTRSRVNDRKNACSRRGCCGRGEDDGREQGTVLPLETVRVLPLVGVRSGFSPQTLTGLCCLAFLTFAGFIFIAFRVALWAVVLFDVVVFFLLIGLRVLFIWNEDHKKNEARKKQFPRIHLEKGLSELKRRGFNDKGVNVVLLEQYDYDMDKVLDRLTDRLADPSSETDHRNGFCSSQVHNFDEDNLEALWDVVRKTTDHPKNKNKPPPH